jgi:hypothetical protein
MSLQLSEISPEEVRHLAAKFEDAPLTDVLAWIWKRFGTRAAIGTSFQGAGLVMIDQALRAGFSSRYSRSIRICSFRRLTI